MARWEPNARERLERAALALFVERGYDATTVAQIAERAGLAKSSFFRHYADKREVLFGGGGGMVSAFAETIETAPPDATAIDCVAAALQSAAGVFSVERHDLARLRQSVVAAHTELQERELLKMARLRTAMADALRARDVPEMTARLAAEVGVLALTIAFGRWIEPGNERPYPEIADAVLRDLQAGAAVLGAEPCPALPVA